MQNAVPVAIEAEQALLGAIFIQNEIINEVSSIMEPRHFYEPLHRDIYQHCIDLIAEGKSANPITLKSRIPADAKVGSMTLMEYLARLAGEAVTISGASDYALAIVDAAAKRSLVDYANKVIQNATAISDASGWDCAVAAAADLEGITDEFGASHQMATLGSSMHDAIEKIREANEFRKPAGIMTGLEPFDDLVGPLEPGQQVVIGGGTKQGKTALAMQAIMGLARSGPVFIYSGEMSLQQLAMREIARRTGISVPRQKEGRVSRQELADIEQVYAECASLPIFIERRRLTLAQIHRAMKDIRRRHGLVACVVDHINLLRWDRGGPKTEWEQSQEATRGLKAIYEDLQIVGLSLAQLKKNTFVDDTRHIKMSFSERINRAIYRRPKYADLVGAVERDADHVVIPFNPVPIIAEMEPQEGTEDYGIWQCRMQEYEGKAQLLLALSREKRWPQRRSVSWNGETTSFGEKYQRIVQEELL